jgi:predicted small secreted protein
MTSTADRVRVAPRVTMGDFWLMAALIVSAAALAACSTTEGFGKDVKNLGGGIEDSAARNK